MTKHAANLRRAYPEVGAGGFSRVDGTLEFYARVNALLAPDMMVLDVGAGRGEQLQRAGAPFKTSLARIQGKVARLVGVDVDEAVRKNPYLDEAHVIDPHAPLPFADGTFDLVYADWVLEHVDRPAAFASEVHRVLKPDGWFCARTPNRWGMTGLGANLIPNSLHTRLLKRLQPYREAQDVFPTTYKLNTKARLRRHFRPEEWGDYSYFYNSEPPYVQGSGILFGLAHLFYRLAPTAMATNLHIFMRRK